jgi:hypothetical protein
MHTNDHPHTPATSFPRSNGAPNLVTLERLRAQPRTRLATGRARRLLSRPACSTTS